MTEAESQALFEQCVVTALKGATKKTMKFGELRHQTQIRRGITDILTTLKTKEVVSWQGELDPTTEITLSNG